MDVFDALTARRSVRGFRPDPVPAPTLRRIFEAAQRAPSWCNIQPWRVWVTSGEATASLTRALTAAASTSLPEPDFPWPAEYPPPYDAHRRECGAALYRAMGIAREDRDGRKAAWMRNYVAFDAPHVAIVGMDRRFGVYASLDIGCWLQSVLLAATSEGVATCPQAALASYPKAVREVLAIPDEIGVLFGIALGYEDPSVPANACRTDRAPLEENVRFVATFER
ncbi:MAG TPA: nitroreductase [Sandaracinaceae bacterium]